MLLEGLPMASHRLNEDERFLVGEILGAFVRNPYALNLTRFVREHSSLEEALRQARAAEEAFRRTYTLMLEATESVVHSEPSLTKYARR